MSFKILNNVVIYKQRNKFRKQNIDNKMNELDRFKNGEGSKNNIFFGSKLQLGLLLPHCLWLIQHKTLDRSRN